MKKVLIFVLVLIVAVALIGPKIVSIQLASGIQNAVDNVNKNPAYKASITSIQSAWFNTEAVVKVGLDIPGMAGIEAADYSVDLQITGNHGPFIFHDGFAIGWLKSEVQTQSDELPAGLVFTNADSLYMFKGLTGIFGGTTYQDAISALTYTDAESQMQIEFSGLTGNGEMSGGGFTYSAESGSLNMNVADIMRFDIQGIELDIQSPESIATIMTQGLYDSNSRVGFKTMTFNDLDKGTQVSVDNTEFKGVTNYDKSSDLGGVVFTTTVDSVEAPDMMLSDLLSVIEIQNIQAKFLLAYQDFSNKMLENMSNTDQMQADLDTFMNTHLLAQLKAKPEYNFSNISGNINGSEFSGNILASVGEITELPNSLEDTAFWMKNAVITSAMLVEKEAAEFIASMVISRQLTMNPNFAALSEQEQKQIVSQQVQGTLDGVVQQGMLTLEDEKYRMAFTLQDGVALLNGQQIPL